MVARDACVGYPVSDYSKLCIWGPAAKGLEGLQLKWRKSTCRVARLQVLCLCAAAFDAVSVASLDALMPANAWLQQKSELCSISRRRHGRFCVETLLERNHSLPVRPISCASEIETTYYSAPCCLPPVCCHCGVEDNLLDDFSECVEEMREKLSVVRPNMPSMQTCRKRCQILGTEIFRKKKKKDLRPPPLIWITVLVGNLVASEI